MKKLLSILLLSITICSGFTIPAMADVKMGVLAHRGELDAIKKWTDLTNHFSEKMGEKVELVPLAIAKNLPAAENKEVDFIMTNPVLSAAINAKYNPTLLATLNKNAGSQFGGVIIASKKSGITNVQDLKGKKVLTFKIGASAGANVFQHYHLKQKGIDVNSDFAMYKEGKKQDDIVLAVKSGMIDAGFVRTGLLESMVKAGKISMDDVVVLDKVNSDFPLVHSTALYPEWFLMALEGTDAAKAAKIKEIALAMTQDDKASQTAGIKGFVEPLDLTELTNVLQNLKVPPFDQE
jgi:ABC-type phosphate/phosphonate transport system substrate-binding protein